VSLSQCEYVNATITCSPPCWYCAFKHFLRDMLIFYGINKHKKTRTLF